MAVVAAVVDAATVVGNDVDKESHEFEPDVLTNAESCSLSFGTDF